jgi:hypothetical protein
LTIATGVSNSIAPAIASLKRVSLAKPIWSTAAMNNSTNRRRRSPVIVRPRWTATTAEKPPSSSL